MVHYLLFLIVIGVVSFFVGHGIIRLQGKTWSEVPWEPLNRALIVTVAVGLVSPFIYEFSGWPTSVPVTFDGEKVIQHPYGMFTLDWREKYSNFPLEQEIELTAPSVTVLTDNPKVKKISHKITVRFEDAEKFYSADPSRQNRLGSSLLFKTEILQEMQKDKVLKRLLYGFNNAHSKDLALLFDPTDKRQQETYRALLDTFIGPMIHSNGCVIVDATFDID